MMALMAERGAGACRTPLHVVALLPIITPPFVVGLGLDFAVWPRGHCQPVFGMGLWHTAHALVLRLAWRVGGADVCLHAHCLHDHARRGAGRGPSLEEAAQTLRADRQQNLLHHHPAAAQARLGQRVSWWVSSKALPTLATRSSWAGSSRCCPPTSSSPLSVRSTTRAAPRRWRGFSRCLRLLVFALQRGLLGKQNYTTVSRARVMRALPWHCPMACAAL